MSVVVPLVSGFCRSMEKCRYYNDSVSACALMIDDLANTATTIAGELKPNNDWGYGKRSEQGLYHYLERELFAVYPEIKGTILLPTAEHALQNRNSKYEILGGAPDEEFAEFAHSLISRFEIAFHGTTHGRYIDETKTEITGNWQQEFEYLTQSDIPFLKRAIQAAEQLFGVQFSGGKYPGYLGSEVSMLIIEELGFKWWASSCAMINRRHPQNSHRYFGQDHKLVDLPANISGNIFDPPSRSKPLWLRPLHRIWRGLQGLKAERYIEYLIEKGLSLTIQEHYQNLRTDGKRQTPSLYDDIDSLKRIYSLLRGVDIWHTTCGEIAHYLESYDHTDIVSSEDGTYRISYNGGWDRPFLSIKSGRERLKCLENSKILTGHRKGGCYLYNDIKEGTYREL